MSRYILLSIFVLVLVSGIRPAVAQDPVPSEDAYLDQEGRYKLLVTTTAIGAVEGAAIPLALGSNNVRTITSLMLAGASAGFFVPFMLTLDRPVPESQATFTLYGGLQGFGHGLFLSMLLAGEDLREDFGAAMVGLSTAGQAAAGYILSERYDLSAGTGELMLFGSAYGAWSGFLASALIFGDDNDVDPDVGVRTTGALALLGSLGGSFAARQLSKLENFTQGDARILARTGLLGIQAASTILILSETFEVEATSFVLIQYAGTFAGLGGGYLLTHARDFTRSEANIIFLGSLAGSLFTSAIAFGLEADSETYAAMQLLGSAAGFGFTYLTFKDDAARRTGLEVGMRVSPTLLYTPDLDEASLTGRAVPGVNLSFTF